MVRWHHEALPGCLTETSRRIMVIHQQLSEQLTTLATSVSQLDGAGRSLEQLRLGRLGGQPDARSAGIQLAEVSEAAEACGEAIRQSRATAEAAVAEVVASVEQLDALRCRSAARAGEEQGRGLRRARAAARTADSVRL